MPWVKLDDHFDEHPKLANISLVGVGLWVTALAYCNRNLTDGFIPWSVARRLGSLEVVDERGVIWELARGSGMSGDDLTNDWIIAQLIEAGLWEEVYEDSGRLSGYRVHDFEDYQPSKAEVQAERARNAERQRRHRERLANEGDMERNAVTNTVTTPVSNGDVTALLTDVSQPRNVGPVPVPVPVPEAKQASTTRAGARAPSEDAVETAEVLVNAPWVHDSRDDVARAVERSFSLVKKFQPGEGPVVAEKYCRARKYGKSPPDDWYRAWLNFLKIEVRDDEQRAANGRGAGPVVIRGRFDPASQTEGDPGGASEYVKGQHAFGVERI